MKHYYLIAYIAPNDRVVQQLAYTTRKVALAWFNKNLQKVLSITKLKKKEYFELGGK